MYNIKIHITNRIETILYLIVNYSLNLRENFKRGKLGNIYQENTANNIRLHIFFFQRAGYS